MKLSQKGNTQILIVILLVVVGCSAFLYFRYHSSPKSVVNTESSDKLVPPTAPQFKTYTNTKYGFSIQYPETLVVREYPDTKDGAGFRPANTPEDPMNEVIDIRVSEKTPDMAKDSLADFAKVAATIEIQNYQKLNSIKELKTNSGIVGYATTWDVIDSAPAGSSESAKINVSTPITYFDLTKAQEPSTVQVTLGDKNYSSDYEAMIKTFGFSTP